LIYLHVQVMGATTIDEHRKYIERDAALERRFQPVYVDEPTEEQTLEILKVRLPALLQTTLGFWMRLHRGYGQHYHVKECRVLQDCSSPFLVCLEQSSPGLFSKADFGALGVQPHQSILLLVQHPCRV
jgi:hypothetical protein